MTETKKTVEQLKAEYESLTAEVKDIQERLVALQPAVDEFGRLSDRLQELNGYGRSKVILAKLALKDALFEREIGGADPHKPVIAADPMMVSGVTSFHTAGFQSITCDGVSVLKGHDGEAVSAPKLVIDEATGKGYWR